MSLRDLAETKRFWIGVFGGLITVAVGMVLVAVCRQPPVPMPLETVPNARIERVYSGHSVKTDQGQKVIYAGIRAPHKDEPLFLDAKGRNTELVQGRKVRLRFDQQHLDRKGRLSAYAFVKGQMVNEILVREGLAYVCLTPSTTRFAEMLLNAQKDARAAKKGLWKRSPRVTETSYPADPKYGNFHRPACQEVPKIKPERLLTFAKRSLALDQGLAPCVKCQP
ncbi:MAG: thermonuclease family protein [Phycisphaerae bacterium]